MERRFRPTDDAQVRDVVAWACAEDTPLEIAGAGSKRGLGRPGNLPAQLALDGLSGIVEYEPAELALSARAGTPLAEIAGALEARKQHLAFEPPDLGALLGADPGAATIGGTVACNLSGPRRFKAGAARDHFLGARAVNGRGESFKTGGKVVKNVSGYDLCKLLAGSWGTLGVLTDVTVKVLPAPEKTRTVLLYGLDDEAGVAVLGEVARSALEATALAHLPAAAAARSHVSRVADAGAAVTAARLEGPEASVLDRCERLRALLARRGDVEELHRRNSDRLWREVGGAALLAEPFDRAVWRVSVPPAGAASLAGAVAAALDARFFFDWAGGLIWLSVPVGEDAGAAAVRGALAAAGRGGHATLFRAPDTVRARVAVFEPQPAPLAALSARVKRQFDPQGVLNPGRMVAGA